MSIHYVSLKRAFPESIANSDTKRSRTKIKESKKLASKNSKRKLDDTGLFCFEKQSQFGKIKESEFITIDSLIEK